MKKFLKILLIVIGIVFLIFAALICIGLFVDYDDHIENGRYTYVPEEENKGNEYIEFKLTDNGKDDSKLTYYNSIEEAILNSPLKAEHEDLSAPEDFLNHVDEILHIWNMEHIFAELKDFTQYRGGLGYLFLESKVFELLSVYLSEVLELSILASTYVAISRSDRDSIIEAKRIIDSQLALAPSCEELARQVNISTSKLTKGFSSLFGTSVHAYVIDQRLEKAASLLLESNLNVSQVAILVGYKLIPMITCSVKIGEELSAAAITRGLGAPVKRTNICQLKFNFADVVLILFCCFVVFWAIASPIISAGGILP